MLTHIARTDVGEGLVTVVAQETYDAVVAQGDEVEGVTEENGDPVEQARVSFARCVESVERGIGQNGKEANQLSLAIRGHKIN